MSYNPLSIADIRARIIAATAGSLGVYQIPGQPDQPAIRVIDRQSWPGAKIKKAGLNQPVIPALEVVINPVASYSDLDSNYNQSQVAESYTVYLIWHDQRQPQRQTALTLMATFKGYSPELSSLEATEIHPQQHVLRIQNKLVVSLHA